MIPNFKDINAWNGSGGIIQNADGILANLQNSAEVISKIKDRVEGALTYMDDKNFEDMLNKQSTSLSSFATSNTQQLGSLLETFPHSVANKFMNADFTQNMMAMPRQLYSKLTNIATILSSVRAPSNLKEVISTIGTLREAVAEMKDATSMIEDGVNQINSLRSHLANGNYLGVFIQAGEVCKFVEKTSQFAAKYPYNQAYETEGGHVFETDNTPGKERLHIQHCTGTDVEIAPNGDMVSKIKNDCQFIVEKDFQNHVKGDQLLLVDNTAEIESKTMKFTATEDLNISAKKTTYTTDTLSILADKTLISNNDSLTLATNSSSSMSSVGPMYITSDSQIVIDAPTIFIGTGRTQLIDMKSTSTNIKSGTVYISDGLIKMNGFITLN
jgi:uncharacterized protein with NAD-binding domain and iron-sulfur cluster